MNESYHETNINPLVCTLLVFFDRVAQLVGRLSDIEYIAGSIPAPVTISKG